MFMLLALSKSYDMWLNTVVVCNISRVPQGCENLQKGYLSFEENNYALPKVSVLKNGDYQFQ